MLSRRLLLAGSMSAGLVSAAASRAPAAAILTDDGIYTQPWFVESFLELPDDLEAATARKKRFAVMWELRGCPFCRQTHLVNFAKPEIESYVKERFDILQLNIIGAREAVDFDGEKLSEKALAARYGVRFTPTIQFFPERKDGLGPRAPQAREVLRVQGYQQPDEFLATFRFVAERGYERGTLQDHLKARS